MTPAEAAAAIRASAGRFFACTFIKADGSARVMRCRYAEVRKVAAHRQHETTITVWDDEKQAWRSIPVDRLTELRIDGQTIEVRQ